MVQGVEGTQGERSSIFMHVTCLSLSLGERATGEKAFSQIGMKRAPFGPSAWKSVRGKGMLLEPPAAWRRTFSLALGILLRVLSMIWRVFMGSPLGSVRWKQ